MQVKKGKYPGGPKTFIESKNVLNGGATQKQVERLYCQEKGIPRSSSRRGSRGSVRGGEMVQKRGGSTMGRSSSGAARRHSPGVESNAAWRYGPPLEHDDRVARDGYGPVLQKSSSRRSRM